MVKKIAEKLKRAGNTDPRVIAGVAVVFVVVVLSQFAVYSVPSESVAVVTRFGKYVKETKPGLHFMVPFIDRYDAVPVKRQKKQEYGFGTAGNSNSTQWSNQEEFTLEKTMVTGDLNSVEVEWIIQYRLINPKEFLFNVIQPEDTLRDVSESVMREVVGDRTVDEVLTIGRQEIEAESLIGMQDVVDKYEMGLHIDQVQLKNVNPPPPVRASFDEVNEAQQERERFINVSNGEYNRTVPRAQGEANQKIQQAEGYALQRVNEAYGDVARFNAMLEEYLKAPQVTKRRIYLETMADVLPAVKSKIIIEGGTEHVLPFLSLGDSMKGGAK
ncbi:MAG: membrane protease subunit HflK [Kiritimatiellia bacterium]|jgi:modulator of FtsH protease HflK